MPVGKMWNRLVFKLGCVSLILFIIFLPEITSGKAVGAHLDQHQISVHPKISQNISSLNLVLTTGNGEGEPIVNNQPVSAAINKPVLLPLNKNETSSNLRQFHCGNLNQFVAYSWVCDGEQDCNNGEDENPTLCSKKQMCEETEFKCRNGLCLPRSWLCDGETDCSDGSDELEERCWAKPCEQDEFTCKGHPNQCIPKSWVCDEKADCEDGSDETGCKAECSRKDFKCDNGKCISQDLKCNSFNDCGDNSDEKSCPSKSCDPQKEFACKSGECITKSWRCDGEYDCFDNSDEEGCTNKTYYSGGINCNIKVEECANDPACLDQPWICDGSRDCDNGFDESPELCQNSSCPPNKFQCADGTCIPAFLKCTGSPDCKDGSDEFNCDESEEKICNLKTHFDCGNNVCIPLVELCTNKDLCPNFDKKLCENPDCSECSHNCIVTKEGHYCGCEAGYKLMDEKTCVDVNECELPGACSQTCVNTVGSFTCGCREGYFKDPKDSTKCVAEHPATLLLATAKDIRNLSLNHEPSRVLQQGKLQAARGLDYSFEDGAIFWSDLTYRKIYRKVGSQPEEELVSGVYAEGLAVDWVHKNVYWTDKDKSTVEVASFDGKNRKVLIEDNLDSPRGIAVDPVNGWIFWTDWGNFPKIEKAALDGSSRQSVVLTRIGWPNGITLEISEKRIFWADAKLKQIFSSDYEGKNRRLVLTSQNYLKHPFALGTFEDFVYWSDWDNSAVFKVNKFKGGRVERVDSMEAYVNPMGLKVFHELKQPKVKNICEALACEFMCLPTLNLVASCSCPAGYTKEKDGRSCRMAGKTSTSSSPDATTSKPASTLDDEEKETTTTNTNDLNPVEQQQDSKILWIAIASIIGILVLCCCSIYGVKIIKKLRDKDKVTMEFNPSRGFANRKVADSNILFQSSEAIKANDRDVLEPLKLNNANDALV